MSNITPINRREAKKLALRKVFAGPEASDAKPAQSEVSAALADLHKTFAAFREDNDKRIADLEKGREDVVQNEKVDRINAAVSDMEGQLETLVNQMQAAIVSGGNGSRENVAAKKNAEAFRNWARGRITDNEYAASITPDAIRAASSTDSDPDGGFLVPEGEEMAITRIQGVMSTMRSIADVRTIGAGTLDIPKSIGGASSGWVGERTSRTATSTPQISMVKIPTHEIYAMPTATQKLLDDAAVDVSAWFANEVAIEFDEEEGDAFVNGNGVEKPKGFLSETKVANASWAWGKIGFFVSGAAADVDSTDDLFDAVYGLKPAYRSNARWLMNDATTARVRKLKDGDGNYIWQPGAQLGEPATFMGYPVSHDDNMPDIGANAYPIAFGDFRRGYTIADRIGVRVLRDPYTNKPYVNFYTTKRVGGGVSDFQAIKLVKCST